MIFEIAFYFAAVCMLVSIAIGIYRIFRGPSILDRMLAYDLITVSAVAIAVLAGIRWRTAVYLDWVLVISLIGFLSTVALTLYLVRATARDEENQEQAEEERKEP